MSETGRNTNGQARSAADILELSRAFQASRIVLTAYELEIFSIVDEDGKTSAEIAAEIGADERGTDRLLNALCALDLLTKNEGRFATTPVAAKHLVKGKPDYLAGLMHTVHLWDSWTNLTEAVKNGGTIREKPLFEGDAKWLEAFIAAMHGRAAEEAPYVVGNIDLTGVSRVLDVGGGSGAFSIAFAGAKKDLEATVFDLPGVVSMTRRYVEKAGLSARIGTVAGNYKKDELGTGFDLAFLSAIIHSNSFEENRELVNKVSRCLKRDGRIVISDFIMEENRIEPKVGAVFALNMIAGTPGGDTYTRSEVNGWMEQAGFLSAEWVDLGRGRSLMIAAKRPA